MDSVADDQLEQGSSNSIDESLLAVVSMLLEVVILVVVSKPAVEAAAVEVMVAVTVAIGSFIMASFFFLRMFTLCHCKVLALE